LARASSSCALACASARSRCPCSSFAPLERAPLGLAHRARLRLAALPLGLGRLDALGSSFSDPDGHGELTLGVVRLARAHAGEGLEGVLLRGHCVGGVYTRGALSVAGASD